MLQDLRGHGLRLRAGHRGRHDSRTLWGLSGLPALPSPHPEGAGRPRHLSQGLEDSAGAAGERGEDGSPGEGEAAAEAGGVVRELQDGPARSDGQSVRKSVFQHQQIVGMLEVVGRATVCSDVC